MRERRIALIGSMGTGKTTIGRLLGLRRGWPYLDNDEALARRSGCATPEELLARNGPAALRAVERTCLAEALTSDFPAVLAVAGGAVLDPESRQRLRSGARVVWLRASPATLARRVGTGAGRPWLGRDPAGAIARLDSERRPLYRALADVVVDVDGLSPAQICEQIVRRLAAAVPMYAPPDAFRPGSLDGPGGST